MFIVISWERFLAVAARVHPSTCRLPGPCRLPARRPYRLSFVTGYRGLLVTGALAHLNNYRLSHTLPVTGALPVAARLAGNHILTGCRWVNYKHACPLLSKKNNIPRGRQNIVPNRLAPKNSIHRGRLKIAPNRLAPKRGAKGCP